jgi:hypothetical protein
MDEDNFLPPSQSLKATRDKNLTGNNRNIVEVLDAKIVVPKFPKTPSITKYLNKKKRVKKYHHSISDRRTLIANYA